MDTKQPNSKLSNERKINTTQQRQVRQHNNRKYQTNHNTPCNYKILESSILYNLENITKSILFCKNQRSFSKEKSTFDNIKDVLRLAKIMKMNKTRQDCPTLVFFDFIKAYDTVPKDKLLQKLITLGTPCNIVELINNMLMNFTLSIGKETIHTYRGLI